MVWNQQPRSECKYYKHLHKHSWIERVKGRKCKWFLVNKSIASCRLLLAFLCRDGLPTPTLLSSPAMTCAGASAKDPNTPARWRSWQTEIWPRTRASHRCKPRRKCPLWRQQKRTCTCPMTKAGMASNHWPDRLDGTRFLALGELATFSYGKVIQLLKNASYKLCKHSTLQNIL